MRQACLLLLALIMQNISAQTLDIYKYMEQQIKAFGDYDNQQQQAFKTYRSRLNAEFAEYMRQRWPEYKSKPGKPVPDSPEPPAPIIKEPDTPPSNVPVPFDDITPMPIPVEPPQPVVPLPKPQPVVPDKPAFAFTFYGQKCQMPLEAKHRFTLAGTTENNIADGWKRLSADEYLPVIAQCMDYRNRLRLCDWGYVRFVEQMTMSFFTSSQLNEARLMQMFILTQSGYKVRIAQTGNRLVLLLPSRETIYKYSYLNIGGGKYYVIDSSLGQASFKVFDREFPKEQYFSLRMSEPPALPVSKSTPHNFQSRHDKALVVNVCVNKNLIDFYDDYPLSSHWDIYARASLSENAKGQLYPALRSCIAGKDKPTAANILLHFVQTAFEYATDDKQFGYERPLFGDETLFYPYSDCEDRAILFSIFVRELLGLDIVLLHYPGHLATAVCFNTEVMGDYLVIDGKRYVVCDPTYINADIGQAMPQYKQTAANVIKI
ncbi:MAG: hypothetical protein J1E57_06315 [Prevotella sp.]|nr:hypothetical protein [Prevotella sp.]